jgi:hypothetical protein
LAGLALAASNTVDYYASERDLSTLSPEQSAAAADGYIRHYEDELGIGGKIMNYGLYRSAKNHDSEE